MHVLGRERQFVAERHAIVPSGQEVAVGIKLGSVLVSVDTEGGTGLRAGRTQLRNGSGNGITGRAPVREEVTRPERYELGLIVHVLAAAGENRAQHKDRAKCQQSVVLEIAEAEKSLNKAPP